MLRSILIITAVTLLLSTRLPADDPLPKDDLETQRILAKYKQNIEAGLQWLAKNQARDGHWEVAPGGSHPIPMTALAGHHRRAVGSAWQVSFGNIGGIIAVYSFLKKDGPKFIPGYSICISFTILSIIA